MLKIHKSLFNKILLMLLLVTNFSCQKSDIRTFEAIDLTTSQRQAIDEAIERYNDKKLSKIIELRDYERQIKLFCIHQTVKIRKEAKPSKIFDVIAKLYCAESDPKNELNSSSPNAYKNLSNLSLMPVRYLLVEDEKGSFFISTFELPRQLPYYKKDLPALFTKEERDEIDSANLSAEEIGNRLRQKAAIDRKSQTKPK
jgi:hypothetical protein